MPPYSGGAKVGTTRGLLLNESATFQVVEVAAAPTISAELESWGRLEIPGAAFEMPKQRFYCSFSERHLRVESQPDSAWPQVIVEMIADSSANGRLEISFHVRPSQATTDSEILYSRIQYLLSESRHCLLSIEDLKDPIAFSFASFPEEIKQQLLYRAAFFRKLNFVERVFKNRFSWPKQITPKEVKLLEFIFRGITEGEFTTRQSEITLRLLPAEVDLTKPPFDGPGELHHRLADEFCDLFDRRLSIGPVHVHLSQAEIASPMALRQLRAGQTGPVLTRFSVLDHQVHLRFERKVGQSRKQLRQRLELFKKELAKDDPPELVALLDEPLISDVSAREADLIAMGWVQYNHLPDRYCPQESVFDNSTNTWRVPVWLGYPNGQGVEVGELLIDVKSGKVVSHTPLEEVRSRGKSLARELLHAS